MDTFVYTKVYVEKILDNRFPQAIFETLTRPAQLDANMKGKPMNLYMYANRENKKNINSR